MFNDALKCSFLAERQIKANHRQTFIIHVDLSCGDENLKVSLHIWRVDTNWAVWWCRWGWRWWLLFPGQQLPRPPGWCSLRFDRMDTLSLWWPTCWTMEGSQSLTQLQGLHTSPALNISGTVDPDVHSHLCGVKRKKKNDTKVHHVYYSDNR